MKNKILSLVMLLLFVGSVLSAQNFSCSFERDSGMSSPTVFIGSLPDIPLAHSCRQTFNSAAPDYLSGKSYHGTKYTYTPIY